METAISVNRLTKHFGDLIAVNSVDLQIAKGESFALLGPDGAGKTTALRLLCGALKPTDGDIEINGISLIKHVGKAREFLGYMPQRFSLYENLSVMQNIYFFSELHGVSRSECRIRMNEFLEFSRLTPFANRLAGQLSGGMKQKLALICAIIHNPPILLLDEPTTGVDPVSRRDFWKILHRLLSEGVTLVISTPYMDEAERCSRIGLMHAGRLIMVNTPGKLKQNITVTVAEIGCSQPRAISEYLKSQDYILSVQTFSNKIRVLLGNNNVDLIMPLLKEKGIDASSIHVVSPNIEDIFISKLAD